MDITTGVLLVISSSVKDIYGYIAKVAFELLLIVLYTFLGVSLYEGNIREYEHLGMCKIFSRFSMKKSLVGNTFFAQSEFTIILSKYGVGYSTISRTPDGTYRGINIKIFSTSYLMDKLLVDSKVLDEKIKEDNKPLYFSNKQCREYYATRTDYRGKPIPFVDCKLYSTLTPSSEQKHIVDMIMDEFKNNGGSCSVFISGPPGTGKSSIGQLLACEINNNREFLDTCKLRFARIENCNDIISSLRYDSTDTLHILLCDEIDSYLLRIHENTINSIKSKFEQSFDTGIISKFEEIKNNMSNINSKDDKLSEFLLQSTNDATYTKKIWNSEMDRVANGYHRNIIVIFTTNVDISVFDELDPSYLRKGRISLRIRMNNNHCGQDQKYVYDYNNTNVDNSKNTCSDRTIKTGNEIINSSPMSLGRKVK